MFSFGEQAALYRKHKVDSVVNKPCRWEIFFYLCQTCGGNLCHRVQEMCKDKQGLDH